MFTLIIKLGKYLEKRFPVKVVVTPEDYTALIQRISVIESSAVHKGAVQDLVTVVAKLQAEIVSLRTGFGLNKVSNPELEAMLNGQYINGGDNSNGQI